MKMKNIFLILLILSVVIISGCSSRPGKYDGFAKCLNDKGVTMYGTEWCSHCKNQKAEFGKSFKYVNFVDCDKNKEVCVRAGVKGYPTWEIDGELYPGEQKLDYLSSLTNCEE